MIARGKVIKFMASGALLSAVLYLLKWLNIMDFGWIGILTPICVTVLGPFVVIFLVWLFIRFGNIRW